MVVVARGGAAGAAEVAKGARYIQAIFHQLYAQKARSTERTMGERDKTQISNPNQFSRRLGFGKHVRTEDWDIVPKTLIFNQILFHMQINMQEI